MLQWKIRKNKVDLKRKNKKEILKERYTILGFDHCY